MKFDALAHVVLPAFGLCLVVTGCGSSGPSVSSTGNPLVAAYTVTAAGQAHVEFGKDTTYGLTTSTQTVTAGTPAVIFVAGMQQNTTYHMRAVVEESGGQTFTDVDRVFKTGAIPAGLIPAGLIPAFTTTTTSGLTPQPGIEMLDPVMGTTIPYATDLNGNVIWYYPFADRHADSQLYPLKLLPNGHFGAFLNSNTQAAATSPVTPLPSGALITLREFDLSGNTIQDLTMDQLNTRMVAAGFNVTLKLFSHDFKILPNGHWLIIANTVKTFTNLTGISGSTDVTGDVIVDLDENMNPVWYWSAFDHLDVNRHPYAFPDWTHTNSIDYSTDDGNFIISMRSQNWVIKVDYRNGAGTGNVLWRLGEGGDFKLVNGVDPTDWFYAQHDATYISANTTNIFTLGLLDDGDDRIFPAGVQCGANGAAPCLYSTVPTLQIDEKALTATLMFHQILPASLYTFFGGNTEVLANGNIEYELSGVGTDSYTFEVTPTATPQTVWELHATGSNTYRGFRMPSLYNGVQW